MATTAKWLLGFWMAGLIALTFLWLPPAGNAGWPSPGLARMIAFHLPNAIVATLAVLVAAYFGWRYLARGRDLRDDAKSKTAAALAALFCVLTTVTGSVFARVQWGMYWNWDPKQTCIVLLLLIFAAYFVLRAGIEDPEKRAAVGAVYILFAALMTPMLGYLVPKYMTSLHPKDTGFTAEYRTILYIGYAGFVGLFAWLQNLGARYEQARLALEGDGSL